MLRDTTQHVSTTLGGHFKQQVHQQKSHRCKKRKKKKTLNRPWKRHLFTAWEKETRRYSVALFSLGWEQTHPQTQIFAALHLWTTAKTACVLIWGSQINFCKQANSQMQNLQIISVHYTREQSLMSLSEKANPVFHKEVLPFWDLLGPIVLHPSHLARYELHGNSGVSHSFGTERSRVHFV